MSSRPLKMTTGAKFFLFLLILIPLAYLGASYIKGEDGIANAKKLLGIGGSARVEQAPAIEATPIKESDLQGIQQKLNSLQEENARLREALHNCENKTPTEKSQ